MNHDESVLHIPVDSTFLDGALEHPSSPPQGIVLFAHGSGSSRHSPRNRFVASVLRSAGLSTLLVDLLSLHEEAEDERSGHSRFNIPFLATRLTAVVDWLATEPGSRALPIGLFGASTGAAAALATASIREKRIRAIVSRGGRPDLAGDALSKVRAPTLLIVGGADRSVIGLNQEAMIKLRCESELVIVPGASHLFEEPGALESVATLASKWLRRHVPESSSGAGKVTAL